MIQAPDATSSRPYLLRALYDWCTDNGFTPYVVVAVDASVQVPNEFVKDGEIVLNISPDATSSLKLGNEYMEFKARFSGRPRDIVVPITNIMAIYARENGQGMAFPRHEVQRGKALLEGKKEVLSTSEDRPAIKSPHLSSVDTKISDFTRNDHEPLPPTKLTGRPNLKRIK